MPKPGLIFLLLVLSPVLSYAATCPDGYNMQSNGDCTVHCDVGYSVINVGEPCTLIKGGEYYMDTPHDVKYGDASEQYMKRCPSTADGRRGTIPNTLKAISVSVCLLGEMPVRYEKSDRGNCIANQNNINGCMFETHGHATAPCYYTTGDDGAAVYDQETQDPVTGAGRYGCVGYAFLISCDPGYYTEHAITSAVPATNPCNPVGTGYYSPDGDMERYPCPENTASCGYGDCAKSIEDCKPYRILRTSNNISVMLHPDKRETPALAIRTSDGRVWYSDTDIGERGKHINIKYNGVPYAVINPMDRFIEVTAYAFPIVVLEKP